MTKGLLTVLVAAVASVGLLFAIGCESDAQTGALIGTGAGALAGQAIGRNTTSTLIGAGIGAGAGYMIGNEQDKKKAAAQTAQTSAQMEQMQQQMNTVTVNITNSNGSITPVTLRRQGVVYIGPRGETYSTLPTEEQLKKAGYGF
jgi:flagellar basal body-associated protein FliL